MKFGVVVFPGSNSADDTVHALHKVMEQEIVRIWHKETDLPGFQKNDCIIIPGGFSFGDHLRAGAIACLSPIMNAVTAFAEKGGYVWGIGNGFQILCEAGLLPGALLPNRSQKFECRNVRLKVVTVKSAITANVDQKRPLTLPIAHGAGRYYADEAVLQDLRDHDQILFQYCAKNGEVSDSANPDGSLENIAGICNRGRNVFGLMPHPERAVEKVIGNTDGRVLFESILATTRLGTKE